MTPRPSVHLCIATGQNLANLIPALQLDAQKVVIFETPAMKSAASHLKRALESHGITVQRCPFNDSTPETIQRNASEVGLEFGEGSVIFNATGGHKLMTLALTEELPKIADDVHLLYAETRHQRLDWLKPTAAMEPMQDVLKVDDFLLVQGYNRVKSADRDGHWQVDADARAALTRRLGDESDKLARFFGTLNKMAHMALPDKAKSKPFRPVQHFDFTPGGRNAEILTLARELGLLSWDNDTEIVFSSEEAATYFGGGWLEEFVWLKLRGIKPFDHSLNLVIKTVGGDVPNELDAVVAHKNRLLVIECKTLRFGRDPSKDADLIYKLAQISKQVGGAMANSLLLSARPVGEEAAQRAKQYGVSVLAAEEVKNFTAFVRNWMESA
jgi:Domain of unknown function (DUF1887)